MEELIAQRHELEAILDEKRAELDKVMTNIQKAQELQKALGEKQSEICTALDKLNTIKESLISISDELDATLTRLEQCSRVAIDCIAQSSFYISRYLDISMSDVSYTAPKAVTMRKCLNLEYAGKQYDYRDISDDDSDPRSFIKKKYPDVSFSNIDEYGNTYPDFSKYSKFSYKFPPVTKENLEAGTCLVGDSKTGSADFKKFRAAMEAQGYSKREIAELLSTHTIHHHQDGQTMQLIPRDLHEACKHNGGAEKIRLMKSSEIYHISENEGNVSQNGVFQNAREQHPSKTFYSAPNIAKFKSSFELAADLSPEEKREIIDNQKAFEGSLLYLQHKGVDFDALEKATSTEDNMKILSECGIDKKEAKQTLSIYDGDFLSEADGSHIPLYSTKSQTAGDSYEWYRFFVNLRDGKETAKEVSFDLSSHKDTPCAFLGYNEKIENTQRITDVVRFEGSKEIHEELKIGRVYGAESKKKFRQELYGDDLRLRANPNQEQEYRIRKNSSNKKCLLDDKEQLGYLYAMCKRHPNRVRVYFNDELLSLQEMESMIGG